MAELPRYSQQTNSYTPELSTNTGVMATPEHFGDRVGQSMRQLGGTIGQASDIFERIAEKDDQLWSAQAQSKAELHWAEKFQAMKEEAQANGTASSGFFPQFKSSYEKYIKEQIKSAPSGRARDHLALSLNEMGLGMAKQAIHFEAMAQVNRVREMHQETIGNIMERARKMGGATSINKDGSMNSSYDIYRQQIQQVSQTAQGIVSPADIQTAKAGALNALDEQEITAYSAQYGSRLTADAIDQGKLGVYLDDRTKFRKSVELRREAYIENQVARKHTQEDLNLYLKRIEEGEFTSADEEESVINAYAQAYAEPDFFTDPIDTPTADSGTNSGTDTAVDIDHAQSIDPAEVRQKRFLEQKEIVKAEIEESKSIRDFISYAIGQPRENIHTQLEELSIQHGSDSPLIQKITAWTSQTMPLITPEDPNYDPVAYTMQDSKIKMQRINAQHELKQVSKLPPNQQQAARKEALKKFKAAIDSSVALQQKAGIQSPRVVTQKEASFIVEDINHTEPDKIIEKLKSYHEQFGDYTSSLHDSLQNLPNSQGILPNYQILAAMPSDSPSGINFCRALSQKREDPDIYTRHKTPQEIRTLHSAVSESRHFSHFASSLRSADSSSEPLVKQFEEGIQTYAGYLHKTYNIPMKEAGSRAAEEILGNIFQPITVKGTSLSIPRKSKDGKDYSKIEVERIQDGLAELLKSDEIYRGIDCEALRPGITSEKDPIKIKRFKEQLRNEIYFVNSPDGSKARLVLMADRQPRPVVKTDGSFIEIEFEKLKNQKSRKEFFYHGVTEGASTSMQIVKSLATPPFVQSYEKLQTAIDPDLKTVRSIAKKAIQLPLKPGRIAIHMANQIKKRRKQANAKKESMPENSAENSNSNSNSSDSNSTQN